MSNSFELNLELIKLNKRFLSINVKVFILESYIFRSKILFIKILESYIVFTQLYFIKILCLVFFFFSSSNSIIKNFQKFLILKRSINKKPNYILLFFRNDGRNWKFYGQK